MTNEIIYIQWDSYFGGLERISQLYEEKFARMNPLVVILSPTKIGFSYKNVHIFKERTKVSFLFKYFMFIKKYNKSIIHIQYAGTSILFIAYLAGAAKILFHFHGTQFPNKTVNKLIWRFMMNKTIIVANSLHTHNVIRKKLGIKKHIEIIPNLIETDKFKFIERTYTNSKFIITYAGRFDLGKNIALILDSARELNSMDSQIEFLLVGDGPEKENIQRKIKANSLESSVRLMPYTEDILNIYYKSHLFVFASRYESFGNVVAEAILTGLPVLCYKIPALTELITDNFFFFEDENPKLLAEKILYIKNNYKMINDRLKDVHKYLNDYIDNEKIIDKLNSIYKSFNN